MALQNCGFHKIIWGGGSIIFTPTSTITAEAIKQFCEQEVLWIHLLAKDFARYDRLSKRTDISDEELNYRMKSGDSLGNNKQADINIDTSEISPEQSFLQIMMTLARLTTNKSFFNIPNFNFSKDLLERENASVTISATSVDDLVRQGVKLIHENGERFQARAGDGIQSCNVTYTLEGSLNRLHKLRSTKSIKYFAREMIAYFKGSLKANEGLAQASPFWNTLADENGEICSNYGYYVFHEKSENNGGKNQFEWVIDNLMRSPDSRKAIININQVKHKSNTKDFPCTLGMQFHIKNNKLCCEVSSRSTDVYTGLPYDMGFFSFVTELVHSYLQKHKYPKLELGHTSMKANFTQIYDKTSKSALELMEDYSDKTEENKDFDMPRIEDADMVLRDIDNCTYETDVMAWIQKYADLKN